jgi:hypothetical protein
MADGRWQKQPWGRSAKRAADLKQMKPTSRDPILDSTDQQETLKTVVVFFPAHQDPMGVVWEE